MQKQQEYKEWLNKKEILEIYPIGITTYKRRIKKLNSPQYQRFTRMISKKVENSNLKEIQVREIHKSFLEELFGNIRVRIPKKEDKEKVVKWVNHHKWDWFANVKPSHTKINELEGKMYHLFYALKMKTNFKKKIFLFYCIEQNTENEYYHAHFLISSKNNSLSEKLIKELLNDICEENTRTETLQYLKSYNYEKFGTRGSNYTLKDLEKGYNILK